MTQHTPTIDHRTVYLIASRAECDPRTVRRALAEGVDTIRVAATRERLARELARLGMPEASR